MNIYNNQFRFRNDDDDDNRFFLTWVTFPSLGMYSLTASFRGCFLRGAPGWIARDDDAGALRCTRPDRVDNKSAASIFNCKKNN